MKSHTDIIIELIFPHFSRPSESRFTSLFSILNKKAYYSKRQSCTISLPKIESGEDRRTSIIIKNLPPTVTKEYLKSILTDVDNINYVYLPFDKKNNKILGFAFVNVVNYKTILQLHHKLYGKKFDDFDMKKQIEICYSKVQGKSELIKMFKYKDKVKI